MNCPEHLVCKAFGERVYLWLYWHDVPRDMIPLRVWLNPLRYEVFIRAFGRVVKINPEGRWARRLSIRNFMATRADARAKRRPTP